MSVLTYIFFHSQPLQKNLNCLLDFCKYLLSHALEKMLLNQWHISWVEIE